MSVQYGYLTRSQLISWVYLTEWYLLFYSSPFVVVSVYLLAPPPLCILGNSCPMGQLPASALCFCMLLHMINVKPILQWLSYFVYPWRSGSIWLYPCLICGENPQGTFTPLWLYTKYFLCLRQFWLLSFGFMNHVDTSQLERLWRGDLSWHWQQVRFWSVRCLWVMTSLKL